MLSLPKVVDNTHELGQIFSTLNLSTLIALSLFRLFPNNRLKFSKYFILCAYKYFNMVYLR